MAHVIKTSSLFRKQIYVQKCQFPFCNDIGKFDNMVQIGQGTYGKVYKAIDRYTRNLVAMKKIMVTNEMEGFPITAIREIKILQLLRHENIVNMIEICRTKASRQNKFRSEFFLIMDFCEHDLAAFLANKKVKLKLGEIKKIIKMILEGLYYIHINKSDIFIGIGITIEKSVNQILHRDLKPANILLTKEGILKLADFGLARSFSTTEPNCLTVRVVTLWYRAPELLLGEKNYGTPIDMWSAGCIMAELWTRIPILCGNSEQEQLNLISKLCGSINPIVWPDVDKLPLYRFVRLAQFCKRRVHEKLMPIVISRNAMNLLDKMLTLDPSKRIDADTALNHDFFWSDPMPCDLDVIKLQSNKSNFTYFLNR